MFSIGTKVAAAAAAGMTLTALAGGAAVAAPGAGSPPAHAYDTSVARNATKPVAPKHRLAARALVIPTVLPAGFVARPTETSAVPDGDGGTYEMTTSRFGLPARPGTADSYIYVALERGPDVADTLTLTGGASDTSSGHDGYLVTGPTLDEVTFVLGNNTTLTVGGTKGLGRAALDAVAASLPAQAWVALPLSAQEASKTTSAPQVAGYKMHLQSSTGRSGAQTLGFRPALDQNNKDMSGTGTPTDDWGGNRHIGSGSQGNDVAVWQASLWAIGATYQSSGGTVYFTNCAVDGQFGPQTSNTSLAWGNNPNVHQSGDPVDGSSWNSMGQALAIANTGVHNQVVFRGGQHTLYFVRDTGPDYDYTWSWNNSNYRYTGYTAVDLIKSTSNCSE